MPAFKPRKQAYTNANKGQPTLLGFTGSRRAPIGREKSDEYQTSSVTDPAPSSRLDIGPDSGKEQNDNYTVDLSTFDFDDSFSYLETERVPESSLAPQEGNGRLDDGKDLTSQAHSLGTGLGTQELPTHQSASPVCKAPVTQKRQSSTSQLAEVPLNTAGSSSLGIYRNSQDDNSLSMWETKTGQKRELHVARGGLCP